MSQSPDSKSDYESESEENSGEPVNSVCVFCLILFFGMSSLTDFIASSQDCRQDSKNCIGIKSC